MHVVHGRAGTRVPRKLSSHACLEGRGSPRGELMRVKKSTLSALESLCIMLMTAAGPNGVSSWRRHLRPHLTFALTLAPTLARS